MACLAALEAQIFDHAHHHGPRASVPGPSSSPSSLPSVVLAAPAAPMTLVAPRTHDDLPWKQLLIAAGVGAAVALGSLYLWKKICCGSCCRGEEDKKKEPEGEEYHPGSSDLLADCTVYPAEKLHAFTSSVFAHYGIPEEDAREAADVLLAADLRGIDSHGIARLFTYVELLEVGRINPTPNVHIVSETDSTATVDGDNGLGLVVGPKANRIAIEKAKKSGSGWVSVFNTNHYGIAGYYPIQALKDDIIGISMTNTTKLVVPCFGRERMLGTNPIAIAFPGLKEPPIVIDLATSVVAYGKVEEADRVDKLMPYGWCVDKHGQPTRVPREMKDGGALLTIGANRDLGQHKGYCLSAMVDILCCVLSGANWGPFAPPFTLRDGVNAVGSETVGKGIGHFFGAMRIDGFREVDDFKSQIDHWIRVFRATKPIEGQKVLIPGDPERENEEHRRVHGVPVKAKVVEDMKAIVHKTGVKFDF